ncbi:hypothetical protein ACIQUQ_04880 [Streptomyces sp. NPDC101118]|uniref:hypothetical protein n=1 Tax=Streptomyces sp. NPDC101118 TaxID=3366109 RepID=UPI003804627A
MFRTSRTAGTSSTARRLRNALAVTGTAAAAVVLMAPSAGAAGSVGGAGTATWYASGDKLVVCDNASDGKSVVAEAYVNGRWQYKWHTAGAGKCTDRSYGDLPEGYGFDFRACLGDGSSNVVYWETCGGWAHAVA